MTKTTTIKNDNQDSVTTLQRFLTSLLELEEIEAILVPQHQQTEGVVMPSLISDPKVLEAADPLAPVFPLNAAKLVSRLTRKPASGTIAVVLRPCEIRAFTELIKLKQGSRENLVIVGYDCPGAFTREDYGAFAKEEGLEATRRFLSSGVLQGQAPKDGPALAPACQICEQPTPAHADLTIGLFGGEVTVQADGAIGEKLFDALNLTEGAEAIKRQEVVNTLVESRTAARDKVFEETAAATASIEGLTQYVSDCINCYNCRVACPVCYCKECVMLTDVFEHEPLQYLRWSSQRGYVKMPTDTTFYHLTRLLHMSLSCVGCGQCSQACPNDIPLLELFRTIGHQTQQAFDYEAGNNPEKPLPLSLFEEEEFQEVVGIKQKGA